jgi:hypothetical protein
MHTHLLPLLFFLIVLGGVGCHGQRSTERTSAYPIPQGPNVQIPSGYEARTVGHEVELVSTADGGQVCARTFVVPESSIRKAMEQAFRAQGVNQCTDLGCGTEDGQYFSLTSSSFEGVTRMKLPAGMTSYVALAKPWDRRMLLFVVCDQEELVSLWGEVMQEIK